MKRLILVLAAVGLTASMAGADVLDFATGNGNTLDSSTNSLSLILNTSADTVVNSVENVNLMNNIELSGGNSVNDDFVLTINVGFDFQISNPTWDMTGVSDDSAIRIVSGKGIGPDNNNPDFSDHEILWFEVSDLDSGNSLKFNGFMMEDDGGDESSFFSYYTDGVNPVLGGAVADGGTNTFETALILENGDRFGIAFTDEGNTANRSMLQTLDIEVIPEPATLGMLGMGALITLLVRRICR